MSADHEQHPGDTKFVRTLQGQIQHTPPIWLMRQAGRYLPEYRRIRAAANGFLNLCYSPELATEVTLQPIRRYDFDAAILFSDILIVPHALGQRVWFAEGEGPRLEPLTSAADLSRISPTATSEKFAVVCEAVSSIRAHLSADKSLIGFCGGPWTVATYMVAGRGSTDQAAARLMAYNDRDTFQILIDMLTDTSVDYLDQQINAGVNCVQIFDSWAGCLPDQEFERWVVQPTKEIVSRLRTKHPHIPIIGFPRAAGAASVNYVHETGVNAIGCDTSMPLSFMRGRLAPTGATLQGNLDPLLLVAGGQQLNERVHAILDAMAGKPFVFNLGHGIVPQTPPEHVAQLVETVRSYKA